MVRLKPTIIILAALTFLLAAFGPALIGPYSSASTERIDQPTLAGSGAPSRYTVDNGEPGPRLHDTVQRMLDRERASAPVELLVHFDNPLTGRDHESLRNRGFEPLHTFDIVPMAYIETTVGRINDLTSVPGVTFIENNTQLTYHMDLTTKVINATQTWYNKIEGPDGEQSPVIDGTGVTAVVVDSGIDAGHPDLDYGEKTIMNLKSDSDMAWYEIENSDTSSGHGTHCAGTVAGNGDASGGARRGVAPGARLIGLSTGEAVAIINAYGALEWVYEHSREGHNPYNIRVVSNSWGSAGDFYDPESAIAQITEKLTYENNVVVVFAAGNEGGDGTGYGDDSLPQTNPYANTPSAISVAALERDGTGIAEFSSRGLEGMNETFPDIGAPGVSIWSTAARRTMISVMTKQGASDINPYYFAISGTSMATPHISGVVALLWQACPEMRPATVHDDYSGDDTSWWNATNTRVHEAELILEAAGQYLPPVGENGVPTNGSMPDRFGLPTDFAQGHGLIDVQRAVGIAQTLHELRTMDRDDDGVPDWPEAEVWDAVAVYDEGSVLRPGFRYGKTDTLTTAWKGEWTRFNNQSSQLSPWDTDQSHGVFIPAEAKSLSIELTYPAIDTESRLRLTSLDLVIDVDGDGQADHTTSGDPLAGKKTAMLDLSGGQFAQARGRRWIFNVEGRGIGFGFLDLGILNGLGAAHYPEIMVEYDVSLRLTLDQQQEQPLAQTIGDGGSATDQAALQEATGFHIPVGDLYPATAQWWLGEPTVEYTPGQGTGFVVLDTNVYDMARVEKPVEAAGGTAPASNTTGLLIALLVVMIAAVLIAWLFDQRKRKRKQEQR